MAKLPPERRIIEYFHEIATNHLGEGNYFPARTSVIVPHAKRGVHDKLLDDIARFMTDRFGGATIEYKEFSRSSPYEDHAVVTSFHPDDKPLYSHGSNHIGHIRDVMWHVLTRFRKHKHDEHPAFIATTDSQGHSYYSFEYPSKLTTHNTPVYKAMMLDIPYAVKTDVMKHFYNAFGTYLPHTILDTRPWVHSMRVFLPGTKNVDEPISEVKLDNLFTTLRSYVRASAENRLIPHVRRGVGYWKDDAGKLIKEPVTILGVDLHDQNPENLSHHVHSAVDLAKHVANVANQHSVAVHLYGLGRHYMGFIGRNHKSPGHPMGSHSFYEKPRNVISETYLSADPYPGYKEPGGEK